MKLTLKNFDSQIDPIILERGERYYEDDLIFSLKEQRSGEFEAKVSGTEAYFVCVTIDGDDILEHSCGCPYNKGPVCKHIVAVLYALADGKCDIDTGSVSLTDLPVKKSAQKDELNKLSKEELVEIVRTARAEHRDIDRRVKMMHADAKQYEDKKYVRDIVRDSVDEASGARGGIDYGQTLDAVQGALEVLDVAESLLETNPRVSATIYEAVIETLAPVIARSDDSDGDIGGTLYSAFESLHKLALRERDNKSNLRKEVLDYILKEWSKKKYQGYDWPDLFLNIVANLVLNETEEKCFSKALDKFAVYDREESADHPTINMMRDVGVWYDQNSFINGYRMETIAGIRLKMIERLHPECVDKFLQEHILMYKMRECVIKRNISSCDIKTAIQIAREGVEQMEKENKPGIVVLFKEYVMSCAEKLGDTDTAFQEAQSLFLNSHRDAFSYYRKAKKYAGEKWKNELVKIIEQLKGKKFGDIHKLADVYVEEGMWEDLLKLVQDNLLFAEYYGKRLEKRFPKEIGKIYVLLAQEGMEVARGRGMYQEKCKLLKLAKKLGCDNDVKKVIKFWREKYPQRRALLEEIAKV